jgi:hypothetical protein
MHYTVNSQPVGMHTSVNPVYIRKWGGFLRQPFELHNATGFCGCTSPLPHRRTPMMHIKSYRCNRHCCDSMQKRQQLYTTQSNRSHAVAYDAKLRHIYIHAGELRNSQSCTATQTCRRPVTRGTNKEITHNSVTSTCRKAPRNRCTKSDAEQGALQQQPRTTGAPTQPVYVYMRPACRHWNAPCHDKHSRPC